MITLKNESTKEVVIAPCKNGSSSIEVAFSKLTDNELAKHHVVMQTQKIHNKIDYTQYKRIYILTRPDFDWFLSGYMMKFSIFWGEAPSGINNFGDHLNAVKRFYEWSQVNRHEVDRTILFEGWNTQWLSHCAMNARWIHKHMLDDLETIVEYVDITHQDRFKEVLEKVHPRLKALHINRSVDHHGKRAKRKFENIIKQQDEYADLVQEVINTI